MYEFKDEYLTGIPQIDEEHKRLFALAEEVYQLQQNEYIPDKYDNLRDVLHELRDYTNTHFDHEEAYMESINYKRMFTQKVQHDALRKTVEEWEIDELSEEQDQMITEILELITDWLVNHIHDNDKLIGK